MIHRGASESESERVAQTQLPHSKIHTFQRFLHSYLKPSFIELEQGEKNMDQETHHKRGKGVKAEMSEKRLISNNKVNILQRLAKYTLPPPKCDGWNEGCQLCWFRSSESRRWSFILW